MKCPLKICHVIFDGPCTKVKWSQHAPRMRSHLVLGYNVNCVDCLHMYMNRLGTRATFTFVAPPWGWVHVNATHCSLGVIFPRKKGMIRRSSCILADVD